MNRIDHEHDGGLPDFFIVGAMKCGTTTLYNSLRQHPQVFMPQCEVGFFDIDDLAQHPDFFKFRRGRWHYHPYAQELSDLIDWYASLFDADEGMVLGERSTSYMASRRTPKRISQLLPDAKIICMLRDPVTRVYSNYWHLLRSGEATGSFEKTLRYRPSVLFERGLYRAQIERYLRYFSREQMMFIVFEQFVSDARAWTRKVCEFIGVDPQRLPGRETQEHKNRGRYPWSRILQYSLNACVFHGLLDGQRYVDSHLPRLSADALQLGPMRRIVRRGVELGLKGLSRLNCSRRVRPSMNDETRQLLKYVYEDRNEGLSRLIGSELRDHWEITKV